ncbi:hypothetical protein KP509_25G076300 [Ceratopteris richardii]|uniref:LOB domain-containing protein n=1 Tax=Ceratopteris richardii TaxID=49495 RepID=A0A8T2RRT1_CERRI|nr:hypothetical protein KP509_25G076300 [Ceratopteris richardii]
MNRTTSPSGHYNSNLRDSSVSSLSPGGGGSSTVTQACAACKFQRRKCHPECPLAPYFPPDQPRQFMNVHKLYGVSNTLRILKQVDPSKRHDAMKSILYEADARDRDPVHGCYGIITLLQTQAEILREELEYVRLQLRIHQHNQLLAAAAAHPSTYGQLPPLSLNQLPSVNPSTAEDLPSTPTGVWQQHLALPVSSPTSTTTPNWLQHYIVSSPRSNPHNAHDHAGLDSSYLNLAHQIMPTMSSVEAQTKPAGLVAYDVRPSFDTRSLLDYEVNAPSCFNPDIKQEHAYESSAESSVKEMPFGEQEATADLEGSTILFGTSHSVS